jgi:hypothetical protein
MKTKILLLSCALLPGCVSMVTKMDDGLRTFEGHNVREAIGVLGYPAGERGVNDGHIYLWRTGDGVVAAAVPVGNATFAFAGPLQCQITMVVNRDGIIESGQWQGDLGGCAPWSRMLYQRWKDSIEE